jgi:L,D-peptidoglycan transpeptidase YkuD (ErfK/YbiS/YcfS/YnhG family)
MGMMEMAMCANDWTVIRQDAGGYGLCAGAVVLPAIIGRNGFVAARNKREGDGATPCGRWPLRKIYYRADRINCPSTPICCQSLQPESGWCDDVMSADYNRYITRPFAFRHEQMWRTDAAYDFVGALGYNDAPVISGHGSAIFLHCIAAGKTSTAGCVAVSRDDFVWLLGSANADQHLYIPDSLLTA